MPRCQVDCPWGIIIQQSRPPDQQPWRFFYSIGFMSAVLDSPTCTWLCPLFSIEYPPSSPRRGSLWPPCLPVSAARRPSYPLRCILTMQCNLSSVKQFIRNVRSAKTIADERAVIQKESAAIRASFREESHDSSIRLASVFTSVNSSIDL